MSFLGKIGSWLGTNALAAHQIMCTVGQLGFMMYYGMAAAVAVKVSNYNGTGNMADIRRSANAGFKIIVVMAIIASLTVWLIRNRMGFLFTDNRDVAMLVTQLAVPFILYQIGDGLQCNFSNALRGIADVKPVMRYAFIAYFVISLPVGYIFAFTLDLGLTGIWLSFPFGLTTAGVMFYLRFMKKTKKLF
jgi:MATE family multidrug resistance protein